MDTVPLWGPPASSARGRKVPHLWGSVRPGGPLPWWAGRQTSKEVYAAPGSAGSPRGTGQTAGGLDPQDPGIRGSQELCGASEWMLWNASTGAQSGPENLPEKRVEF